MHHWLCDLHPCSQGLGCLSSRPAVVALWPGGCWMGRGQAGSSTVIIFHPSFVSGTTFSLRSLLEAVLCPVMILADPKPGPLTWLLAQSDLLGFVTRGFSGNHRTSVSPDSHHQTCLILFFGYCGTVPCKDGDLPGLCAPSAPASLAFVE